MSPRLPQPAMPDPSPPAPALEQALEQSHEVHAKVEACADDLAATNEAVKVQLAAGETTLSAAATLADGEAVETTVQECADDLQQVTQTLGQGIADLREIEHALAQSRAALASTSAALREVRAEAVAATHRALHDLTTGLPNRELFDDRLAQAMAMADRRGWSLALMFLDLDRFKSINDFHGHAAGDLVLREVARRIGAHARDEDTVCRNGGDEFLYLLVDPRGAANVSRIADVVLRTVEQPIDIGGRALSVRPSIGIAMYPADATTPALLLKCADLAMYDAKRRAAGHAFYVAPLT
ncbi:MAG: GGDEF domain-containing protein [Deltaproteobacteria bacterium]|nr:GGDEF domain-containing protein [Deltaproteobacteria bacterium]